MKLTHDVTVLIDSALVREKVDSAKPNKLIEPIQYNQLARCN